MERDARMVSSGHADTASSILTMSLSEVCSSTGIAEAAACGNSVAIPKLVVEPDVLAWLSVCSRWDWQDDVRGR